MERTVITALLILTLMSIAYVFVHIIWNLFFHPLARFPGPKFAAISNIPYSYWFLGGRQPHRVLELHLKYGPVVRLAPNELSFNSAASWKDIYGTRPNHQPFIKSDFYDGGSFASRGVHSIVSVRDPAVHAEMRRYLSPAFADRALNEQESLISQSIDKFVQLLGTRPDGYDICRGYEMLTFDIIGDLAFGESFGAIESPAPHPWISVILGALTQGALVDVLKRFPTVGRILKVLFYRHIRRLTKDTSRNEDIAIDFIKQRLDRHLPRKDFITYLMQDNDEKSVSTLQLAAHASDFVIAGSETTATALATITYYLQRTPIVFEKLREEITANFKSYDEIDGRSTQRLKYLKAVILEGMRIYPPLPFALPRVVPPGGDTVDGHFLPANTIVSTNPYASSMDPKNFPQPDKFIPERWLESREEGDTLDATQPFSLGTRSCMGRSLGLLELRLTLCKIIWKYYIELLNPSLNWQADSDMHTLWQKPKLPVKVRARRVA
ncbi:benzoate 4-monooxygenase cytochrome P450 [Xylariaceae sp. FL0255]|nr:benzoate 4-monooxygenase cytochrome P450 [Xylariaceae sp. FL0255]